MRNKLVLATMVSLALTGCKNDQLVLNGQDEKPPTETTPPTDIIPSVTYTATLKAGLKALSGDVYCNGMQMSSGTFTVKQGESFSCTLGSVTLGDFTAPFPSSRAMRVANEIAKTDFTLPTNATRVVQTINTCETNPEQICVRELDAFDIEDIFQIISTEVDPEVIKAALEAFEATKSEESTDEVGKAPSSHNDDKVVPVVDPDAQSDLNSNFVSANAEASYGYKPSADAQVETTSILTDANGTPIAGMSFFSANSVGVTDENGAFEYKWGGALTFGIDTFEFGTVTGNKIEYKLTDVSDNPVVKANIQSLLERYAEANANTLVITDTIQETFALYPNVINELINLSLPNGGTIEGSAFELPREFELQFEQGLTNVIDEQLRQPAMAFYARSLPTPISMDSGQYVTQSLKQIFAGVTTFHVFNDNSSFYGASGYTRGMRALNLSNRAFPVVMPRTDKNRELFYGEAQAWTREGRPYVAEWPGIENMPAIPLVNGDNATYGFPFVTAGEIGKGKVVFMGNVMYPSILSCPDNYWNNRSVAIDSQNKTCTSSQIENPNHADNGSMKRFFANLFQWFNGNKATNGLNIATNIEKAYFFHSNSYNGMEYDFFISPAYGLNISQQLSYNGFSSLNASETPIAIVQAYPPKVFGNGMSHQFLADLENPNLSQDDITALIRYINDGGNVLFMDALQTANPEPIGRLADAAGVSVGGENVTPTNQALCGSSYYCQAPSPNLHVKGEKTMVVLERFQDNQGEQPFTVNSDGSVEWIKDETKIKFEIPQYEAVKLDEDGQPVLGEDGNPVIESKYARIFVNNDEEKAAAIAELQAAFVGTPVCQNAYEWEFNCIETRSGHGETVRGAYHRPDFDRYEISNDVVDSMVKAASLGANFDALYQHELYYRTKGTQGKRLSAADLNQTYDNLSVWMWNDNPYRYDPDATSDELDFQRAVQFLNCYTQNKHQTDVQDALCPEDLKQSLVTIGMIHGTEGLRGQMNPSYPLNYMEKPLTRIMLGRSYWDFNITVDTTQYPGRTPGVGADLTATVQTNGQGVSYSAGNNQSTGLWAPQLQEVTVSGGVDATITVMFADDLTGRPNHETSLKRPPRMQTSYQYDKAKGLSFKSPYGGLIYIQPKEKNLKEVTFSLTGVEKAAWWKAGKWIHHPDEATAPIGEVDTGAFIYTTPVENIKSIDLANFAKNMNRFADAASDFYGRDQQSEQGAHRRFTYAALPEFRHRFVNDVQISIGAAHSGYPVMSSSFNANRTDIPTNALNDWLLWHEVGHNLASAPFLAEGSTEVTNNLLALYMQELDGRYPDSAETPEMDRIKFDIRKAPTWLKTNDGHAWSNGDAGIRLVMFGQLKIWAKREFVIKNWYTQAGKTKAAIYGSDEGWNMFKLMHRLARSNDDMFGDKNYCSSSATKLSGGDLMMVCSSYVSGYDLSDFFTTWNVGETSMTNADGSKVYNGGISQAGLTVLDELSNKLGLLKPENDPLLVDSIYTRN